MGTYSSLPSPRGLLVFVCGWAQLARNRKRSNTHISLVTNEEKQWKARAMLFLTLSSALRERLVEMAKLCSSSQPDKVTLVSWNCSAVSTYM